MRVSNEVLLCEHFKCRGQHLAEAVPAELPGAGRPCPGPKAQVQLLLAAVSEVYLGLFFLLDCLVLWDLQSDAFCHKMWACKNANAGTQIIDTC